jgi:Phosphoesterase family
LSSPGFASPRLFVLAGLLVLLVVGVTAVLVTVRPSGPPVGGSETVPRPDHVVVVMMENKDRSSVIGRSRAPFLNDLASRGANMSQSYALSNHSQPNYLALLSGSQQGVTNDKCRDLGPRANLGSQLADAGLTFTGYSESLPHVGFTGCARGEYRRKHNAWVDFSNLGPEVNQPFSAFPTDYSQLPTVSFVTPNMCNDMHDCSVATGDAWLKTEFARYADWAATHNSLLVVTFDENEGGTVNQIPTVLVGQQVRPGVYPERMNHYTLLRTIEDAYGLAPLGKAAAEAPLQSIWTTAPVSASGVSNGSFESKLDGWIPSNATHSSNRHSHDGSRSARAGSRKPTRGDSILTQTFTVPAGKTRLTVWWKGMCSDRVQTAWATISLKNSLQGSPSTLLPPTCVHDDPWQQVEDAVTPGQTYTLQLVNHDDGRKGTPNRTYFDDVTLS